MKKIFLILVLMLLLINAVHAEDTVTVKIVEYNVEVNDVLILTEESQYPVLSYKNITYFPMTSDYLKGLGLSLSFSSNDIS